MCGIFGISISPGAEINNDKVVSTFNRLFKLSESRGKEASGIAAVVKDRIKVHKSPLTASKLVKSDTYRKLLTDAVESEGARTIIGHSRLVTNGYEHFNKNNQPVVKNSMVAVHNGIIVNQKQLWSELNSEPESDLDSELIPTILASNYNDSGNMDSALSELFTRIEGMTSTAILHADLENLILATNNGSLYYTAAKSKNIFLFASEYHILEKLIEEEFGSSSIIFNSIDQLNAGFSLILDMQSLEYLTTELKEIKYDAIWRRKESPSILEVVNGKESEEPVFKNTSFEYAKGSVPAKFENLYSQRRDAINRLKRCSRCTLPETFPFISFNESGICNYCTNYSGIDYKGSEKLAGLAESIRRSDGRPECLVPFSGGRDSSYVLHYLVKELGLKPIAYSYDWGMLTDLARRNQSRMCGKLGVEHILVSADIRRKRNFIKQNVEAWLKKPDLGMVPLFMAGDKQYFYYTNKLLEENNLEVSFLGENLLETTNFKSGFAGIEPGFKNGNTYTLSTYNKIKMLYYYAAQYLKNPAYINSSLADTLSSFKSYYVIKHKNFNLFQYIKWDEETIVKTIVDQYNWEVDPGTSTTWRIGDGTAAFYNYIYYMVAGFSENDTFRSNQVREGLIHRNAALELAEEDNLPRWDSINWYCNTIGIDFESAVERINQMPALFGIL